MPFADHSGGINEGGSAGDGEAVLTGPVGEQAWLEVIKKMDEVYHELLDYEVALEQKNSALEESQHFIDSVLASMSDILVVCNRAGTIEDLNRSLLKLTGASSEALQGSSILDLFADEASRRLMNEHLERHAAEAFTDVELQMRGADGQTVPVSLSCTPRFGGAGRQLGFVVTGRAIGELRRAYSALRIAHEDLKRTQQQLLHAEKLTSLGRLVAGVAHELNNPISFVLGNLSVLKKYLTKIEAYVDAVRESAPSSEVERVGRELRIERIFADLPSLIAGTLEGAERTRDVVDGLKRFSALRQDARQEVDLVPVVERAVQWVTQSAPDWFSVRLALPARLRVTGSSGELLQVFVNLVQNALDATAERGSGSLEVSARTEGGQAIIEFADDGPGIPPENLPKVFEPFFTTKPIGKGTGLGLSISYGLVERHGGSLSVINRSSGGASFLVRLVLAAAGTDSGRS